jgi:hypothetical protein
VVSLVKCRPSTNMSVVKTRSPPGLGAEDRGVVAEPRRTPLWWVFRRERRCSDEPNSPSCRRYWVWFFACILIPIRSPGVRIEFLFFF